MVAVTKLRRSPSERIPLTALSARSFFLIQGSLSTRRIARQSPLVGGLHRVVDGALIGVLIAVALMSALTLHWQHLWTIAFTRLESTRELNHRLTDSTALIERYLLHKTSLPKHMVPTKVANLLYLDKPVVDSHSGKNDYQRQLYIKEIISQPTNHGY